MARYDDASGGDLAGAFAVEEIAGINAVEEEGVTGVALAVGPDGEIAEASVGAGAAGEFGVHAGREDGQAGETAGGQGNGFELIFFEDVAIGGVDGVQQRSGFDSYGGADLANFEGGVHGGGAISLNADRGNALRLKSVVGKGERVGANREIDEIVAAGGGGFLGAGELGGVRDYSDRRIGKNAAGGVGDGAGDAA